MRPFRKIHIHPEKMNSIQIIQYDHHHYIFSLLLFSYRNRTRGPPISRFKRMVIACLIVVFLSTIVVTIVSLKGMKNKSNWKLLISFL